MVKFRADDITGTAYLAVPKSSRGKGVIVLHAWWGLNAFFKRFCDRLANEGFVAIAPDLHHGHVARTIEDAKKLVTIHDSKPPMKEVVGAVEFLKSHPAVTGTHFGAIGFSMGGWWSLWLSAEKPENVAAVVVFYGTGEADFTKAKAAFLGHYAETDEWEPTEGVKKVEAQLRSAGRPVEFHFYPGVKHWFFEEDRPEFDSNSASLAWKRTVQFLNTKLR